MWQLNGQFSGETIVKEYTGHKEGVLEVVVIDSVESTPTNPDYYVVTVGVNDERIIVKHSRS